MHTSRLCVHKPGLYNPCLCVHVFISLTVYLHSRRRVLLKDYHSGGRPSGDQKMVFLPWLDASLSPPSFPILHFFPPLSLHSFSMEWKGTGSLQREQRWHYCQRELPIVVMRLAGPLLSGCHHGVKMRRENFGEFVEGEIKHGGPLIWHPYLHGISPLRHRQVSQLNQM